uniref:Uncharacterized protein n=1 Tax=Kalanchoe fedtschenkoi TaxID=63787 RepID=A0A7N0VM25_KALFE
MWRVVGTLFGYRREHVHFAFQHDAKSIPALLIELATPTTSLVKEMSSGLKSTLRLVEEPLWRAHCNGKKRGYALKRECKSEEWIGKVLQAVEKVSMGAGVLPGDDSEAFYMMNPDGSGGPELSIYFLQV